MNACPFCGERIGGNDKTNGNGALHLLACPKCLNTCLSKGAGEAASCAAVEGCEDIRDVAPRGTVPGEVLARVGEAIEEMPVLPEVPRRIMAMVHDPLMTMPDLATAIHEDAVLTTKILKLANSALFGGRSEILGLDMACGRLGVKEVTHTVQAVAFGNLYRTPHEMFRELMRELWGHSIATAHCAAEIGRLRKDPHGDDLFLAGLVHDIGKVVLLDILSKSAAAASSRLRDEPEAIIAFLNRYHALVGLHVVNRRDLPGHVAFSTFFHHRPGETADAQWAEMAHSVCLGNALAYCIGYGFGPEEAWASQRAGAGASAEFLGVQESQLRELCAQAQSAVEPLVDAFAA